MMKTLAILLSSAAALAVACGSDTPKKVDAKVFMDSPGSGSGSAALTVKNYLSWCSVTVAGGAASTAASQTSTISNSGPITLTATRANSSFEVSGNLWHHTDGDTGSGDPGTLSGTGSATVSTATVTVTAGTGKCVWVCCPFVGGTGCNVAEQCP